MAKKVIVTTLDLLVVGFGVGVPMAMALVQDRYKPPLSS